MNSYAGLNEYFVMLLIMSLIFGCFHAFFICGLYNRRLEGKKVLLCTVVIGTIAFVPTEISVPYQLSFFVIMAVVLSSAYAASLILKISFPRCLLSEIIIWFLIMLLGAITEYFTGKLINTYLSMEAFLFSQLCLVFQLILILAIIYAIKPASIFPGKIHRAYSVFIILFSILSFAVTLASFEVVFRKTLAFNVDRTTFLLMYALFILYFAGTILFTAIFARLGLNHQELQQQKFYNRTLESITTDLRAQKHGFSNTLATIGGYIKLKQWDALEVFYKESAEAYSDLSSSNAYKLMNVRNVGLAGLLLTKLENSKVRGLHVLIRIDTEIGEIDMPISDLCEVSGILIDNAIEAALCSKGKYVGIYLSETEGMVRIGIENTSEGIPEPVRVVRKGRWARGTEHGSGPWIADGIVKRYKNAALSTTLGDSTVRRELTVINRSSR